MSTTAAEALPAARRICNPEAEGSSPSGGYSRSIMPCFVIYFKTEALRRRLVPLLPQIPPFFQFAVRTGTPEIRYFAPDETWNGFPFPVDAGDVYVFDDEIPARALGGGGDMRAAIRVRPEDPDNVLILRLWHELLHAVGQPADDMEYLTAEWQTPLQRLLWALWPRFCGSVDVPFWHRRYYAWLTLRAEGAP